jgi:hypothetical protein
MARNCCTPMWVSRVTVGTAARPPSESAIAAALRDALSAGPQPAMVVDSRAAAARAGSTSTYRLLTALGLTRAAPVSAWSADATGAWDALDVLLDTLPADGRVLLVAVGGRAPYRWGSAVITRTGTGTGPSPLRRPALPPGAAVGNGFLDLVLAAAVGTERDHDPED